MIEVVAAQPLMAERLRLQQAQLVSGQVMSPASVEGAIRGGMALAAVDGDTVIAMAGIYEIWEDRAMAWALLAEHAGQHMTSLHRIAKRALDVSLFRRIEAYAAGDHAAGNRWLEMLGFQREGVQRSFWQGHDFTLYARVR